MLNIMLIGRKIPGPAIVVGLAATPPHSGATAFSSSTDASMRTNYVDSKIECDPQCIIELRGDASSIEALVDGRRIGRWSRSAIPMTKPDIQLNAEAHGGGDSIAAWLAFEHGYAGAKTIAPPTCAFTTRGVIPMRGAGGVLHFSGRVNAAPGQFVNLLTSARGEKC